MTDVRIEWNHGGFQAVLQSGPVAAMCLSLGQGYLAGIAAKGYAGALHTAGRARFNIYTLTGAAKVDNSRNQTLAKLLG